MAIYFCEIHNGLKGKGASHTDYINREGHSTKAKGDLVAKGYANLPWWAETPKEFFKAADQYERKNGSAYFSFDIALPKELTQEQNLELARKLADYFFQDNKVGAWAVHSKPSTFTNEENIHIHIMRSERIITDEPSHAKPKELFFKRYNPVEPEEGGYQKDDWFYKTKSSQEFKKIREHVATLINEAYAKAGLEITVSEKTYAEQRAEALQKGDIVRAEYFNRKPHKRIRLRAFKKMTSLIKQNKIDLCKINFNEDLSVLSKDQKFQKMFSQVTDISPQIAEVILNTIALHSYRKVYDEYLTKQKELKKLQQEFLENEKPISTTEAVMLLEGIEAQQSIKMNRNTTYIQLFAQIYQNQNIRRTIVENLATKGKARKYRKAKKVKEKIQQQYNELNQSLKAKPKDIEIAKAKLEKAETRMIAAYIASEEIYKSEYGQRMTKFAVDRLSRLKEQRTQECIRRSKENTELGETLNNLNVILETIKDNPDIKIAKKFLKNISGQTEVSKVNIAVSELKKEIQKLLKATRQKKKEFQLIN